MKGFLRRHGEKILGVLSGFDRMRFRGTLRLLSSVGGTMAWLSRAGVLLKDFVKFAEGLTKQVREATEENAAAEVSALLFLLGRRTIRAGAGALARLVPLQLHVVLNGREWLARELDRAKIGYLRRLAAALIVAD